MRAVKRYIFPLKHGWGAVAATSAGLIALIPFRESREEAEKELALALLPGIEEGEHLDGGILDEKVLKQLAGDLDAYYRGETVTLDYPVDWETAGVTEFQKDALLACKNVGYGRWATYGDLAKAIGKPKASRAIGGAMHINPVSLVVP